MSAVDLRWRLTACYDPLGGHHEDRKDHVDKDHVYDGPGICRRTDRARGYWNELGAAKARSSEQQSFRVPDPPMARQVVPQSTRPISDSQFPPAAVLIRQPPAKDRYPVARVLKAC